MKIENAEPCQTNVLHLDVRKCKLKIHSRNLQRDK